MIATHHIVIQINSVASPDALKKERKKEDKTERVEVEAVTETDPEPKKATKKSKNKFSELLSLKCCEQYT